MKKIDNKKKLLYFVFVSGLLLRMIFLLINAEFFTLNPILASILQHNDALGFHMLAVKLSENFIYENILYTFRFNIYPFFLGIIYHFINNSIILGNFISVFAWCASFIILYKIFIKMNFKFGTIFIALLIFSIFPTCIVFTSVTIREPYQLLFLTFFIYKIYSYHNSKNIIDLLLIIFSFIMLTFLHKVFSFSLIFSFFLCLILFFYKIIKNLQSFKLVICILILSVTCLFFYLDFVLFSYNGIFDSLESFSRDAMNTKFVGRTNYRIDSISFSKYIDIFVTIIVSMFLYFFEPFTYLFSKANIVDGIIILENFFRIFVILSAIYLFFLKNFTNKSFMIIIFIVILSTEMFWSLGTNNWGTAVRHHIPSFGLYLILFAFSIDKLLVNIKERLE